MNEQLNILFVAAEINPIAKVGGLADVVGSLPPALQNLGANVVVALPYYDFLKKNKALDAQLICSFKIIFSGEEQKVEVFEAKMPNTSTTLYLYSLDGVTSHEVYGSASMSGGLYINPTVDLERFAYFSLAVAKSIHLLDTKFSVVHCHDWHTGLIPCLLSGSSIKTVYTIHNLANQGLIDNLLEKWLGDEAPRGDKANGQFNFMKIGIKYADQVTTVSESYAQEILTKEYGCNLESLLISQQNKLSGIVNGIDIQMFDPRVDKNIVANFASDHLELKEKNKSSLQKELGLEVTTHLPLIGLVSRFVEQKGLDLITEKIINIPAQFVFLGEGDPKIEAFLTSLAKKYSEKFKVIKGFDLKLAQKIYAASDFFLMPSKFEPCGLGQMIAMRYGSVPIVRATGGLKDTVDSEVGFVFEQADSEVLWKTMNEALTQIYPQTKKINQLKTACMKRDFSWNKSAKKYLQIYNKLANIR